MTPLALLKQQHLAWKAGEKLDCPVSGDMFAYIRNPKNKEPNKVFEMLLDVSPWLLKKTRNGYLPASYLLNFYWMQSPPRFQDALQRIQILQSRGMNLMEGFAFEIYRDVFMDGKFREDEKDMPIHSAQLRHYTNWFDFVLHKAAPEFSGEFMDKIILPIIQVPSSPQATPLRNFLQGFVGKHMSRKSTSRKTSATFIKAKLDELELLSHLTAPSIPSRPRLL